MSPETTTSSFSSAPQKSYKPLIVTGCIPRIEKNRVRFLNGQTVAVGKYCSLYNAEEGTEFDPAKFCVMSVQKLEKNDLSGEMETVNFRFIADMDAKMYHQFMVAQGAAYRKAFTDTLTDGQRIHLFSKNGLYKILGMNRNRTRVQITCNKWIAEYERSDRSSPYEDIPIEDIKCLAGGLHNAELE